MQTSAKGIILPSVISEAFKPLTYQVPVGLLPLVNKPNMEHQVEWFMRHDIRAITISCNHLSNRVEAYFDSGTRWGASISYNLERPPFGFVAALRQMKPHFGPEVLVIVSSDIVADFDLEEALEYHTSKRAEVTFICRKGGASAPGLAVMPDDNGRITAVGTRPQSAMQPHPVDTGICIMDPEVVDLLPETFGHNLLQACWLASQKVRLNLFGYEVESPVLHITGWKTYFGAQKRILAGEFPHIQIPGIELQPGVWVGKNISASSKVSFKGPLIIGDNCRIGKGVTLGEHTIIGHDVMVDVGASLRDTVILSKTFVGPQTQIADAVIQGNLMIELKEEEFVAIEDRLAALGIERPKAGYSLYLFLNRVTALALFAGFMPFMLFLFLLLIVGLKFPLISRVKRLAPDLRELAAGKLRLRVFDLIYLGPVDLTKVPVGHNPDPLTTLPHLIARIGNLVNVIRGDITIVGNRPMDPEIAFSIVEEYRRTRLKCQGGVVSILDTNEVDETTEEEQIISEGYYAVNRNLKLDLSILLRGMWRLFWRMLGMKKVIREYREVKQEESPLFE